MKRGSHPRTCLYSKHLKRIFDVIFSLGVLIVLSPVFIIIFILELVFHGSPAIYVSRRPGLHEKLFSLFKFRSMSNVTDENGNLLPESERLTKLGYILRRFSLDELPEFFNILRGDMSIIGPRPLLAEYLPLYSDRHRQRHSVRPGLACVRIKNRKQKTWTWEDQFENDIYYIKNLSFLLDMKMFIEVIKTAIRGSKTRSLDTRVQFTGSNLHETRPRDEVSVVRKKSKPV